MRRRLTFALALSLGLVLASTARGAEPDHAPTPAQATPSATPEGLLAAADAAVGAGDLGLARSLFEDLAAQFPDAPEANEARRALKIIAARVPPATLAPAPASAPQAAGAAATEPPQSDDIIVRNEPYSRRTSERLRLTIWEKVDFGVTAFLYGMSVGLSFALIRQGHPDPGPILTPVAVGAVVYTVGSVLFLKLANPDRGDLPLTLAIASYLPTTTLLIMTAADTHPNTQTVSIATAATGLLAIPIAVGAAHYLTLDPGDTQLVRDAGFWGLALSTMGALGFAGNTWESSYGYVRYESPHPRRIAAAGLVGLFGGLGLGLLGAKLGEVSLERVRVTTWGGYGGGVVGLLLGAAASNSRERDMYRGAAIGALGGLIVTFLSTGSLDGIPDEEPTRLSWAGRLTPTMVQVAGSDGSLHPGLGLGGTF